MPITGAVTIAEELHADGVAKHGSAGFVGADTKEGPSVWKVTPKGPAAAAGIKPGDVVTEVDGRHVASIDVVTALVRAHNPGDTLTFGITRGQHDLDVSVVLAATSWRESPSCGVARDHGGVTTPEDTLDDLDREVLNAVQWDFPLDPTPYAVLAERLGVDESVVRDRVQKVKDSGVLRQLSAIFDTRALGYTSALVAAQIDADHIDEAAAIVSEHPGVSHNYKRNHAYNLWYTVAVPPGESLDAHIDVLHRDSGAQRHAQVADAQAVQDRREARHDRQDRREREVGRARARASRTQSGDAGARPE